VCAPITISAIGDTLRGIIKNVGVDVRTEQLLMAAEHNAFVQGMLEFEAKLDCDRPIWASIFDRWNPISALAYGYKGFHEGDGHSGCLEAQQRLQALYKLTTPYYLDCLFILQAPWEVIQPRIASRGTACKVEARGEDFLRSVCSAYDSILTYAAWRDGVLQHTRNLIGLDATQAPQDIHREVMSRICSLYNP
jgi:thymidylate kinase